MIIIGVIIIILLLLFIVNILWKINSNLVKAANYFIKKS